MKITIKTLQQSTFKVDIEPDKTVKELKDKIESDHGKDYPSGSQKLIYSGKILADESKLSEYDIDEKKFIVLMITRPPPAPKPAAPEKPAPVVTKKEDPATKSKTSDDSKSKSTSTTTQTSSSSTSSSATGSATSTATTTTTPTNPNSTTIQSAAGNRPTGRASSDAAMAAAMAAPYMDSRLAAMMAQPQFRQIQSLIQQTPHLLSQTIEELAASDPEMYSFISDNPDGFVNALNHPPMAGGRTQSSRGSTTSGSQQPHSQRAQHSEGPRNPAGAQQPVMDSFLGDVSEHDKQAIERLKELGFSEYLAVQAYMACDKDEQLAANLLFQMDQ